MAEHKSKPTIGRTILLLVGSLAILTAFMPIGTDLWRRAWLNGGMAVGGPVVLLSALRSRYQAGLPVAEAIWTLILLVVGLISSLAIDYRFAGGDAFHSYRGFPFRWAIGGQITAAGAAFEWSVYWAGLLVDGLWWFMLALSCSMLWGQAIALFE